MEKIKWEKRPFYYVSNLWNSSLWKQQRAKIIEQLKCCSVCGSTSYLSIHHPCSIYSAYDSVILNAWDFFKKMYDKEHKHGTRHKRVTLEEQKIRLELFFIFVKNHDLKIEEGLKEMDEKYLSMDDVVLLCGRCHWYVERGYVLCQICQKQFHEPRYPVCFDCNHDPEYIKTTR